MHWHPRSLWKTFVLWLADLVCEESTPGKKAGSLALEGWKMERSRVVVEWEERAERRLLVRQLRAKFGQYLPPDLEKAVPTLTPEERDRWIDAVVTTETLEAFRALMGR
jgi:hypothetical protein